MIQSNGKNLNVDNPPAPKPRRSGTVLVTGAAGYIGSRVVEALAKGRNRETDRPETVVAMDVRPSQVPNPHENVIWETADIRSPDLAHLLRTHAIETVVHLASIVTAPPGLSRQDQYSVDVEGTRNVLEACVATGVDKIIVLSSGAAYGYHADNDTWLDEHESPIRGNEIFAYAHHKRLVEEMLQAYREKTPQLSQLVFRPGTVLGRKVSNQITAIFEKPVILGLRHVPTPFVFIWDEDVVACILAGVDSDRAGIYNLSGDGTMTLAEIAQRTAKPYLPLPTSLVRAALAILRRLGLTRYGPEQVLFLRHRPVLANRRLKKEFGYVPRKTTREVFDLWHESLLEGVSSPPRRSSR
ncbi:MAG: SDR family oxidoreductase [Planctomycetota bacterium]|jgi:UDP-glucose 4-epimerase|nr:SDR family oxidoreductase [Planctomycetota bacterium]